MTNLRGSRCLKVGVLASIGAVLTLAVLAGCAPSRGTSSSSQSNAATSSAGMGAHMAGPAVDVHVSQNAIASKPAPWNLTTPESAVRSYLDWMSYSYRIATSDVSTPTMGPDMGVKVDSYIQYNIEKKQLIDQRLKSITFDTPSTTSTSAVVPAHEQWTYSYVSIQTPDKTIEGPLSATYNTTYHLSKTPHGWVVMSVDVKPQGTVK